MWWVLVLALALALLWGLGLIGFYQVGAWYHLFLAASLLTLAVALWRRR